MSYHKLQKRNSMMPLLFYLSATLFLVFVAAIPFSYNDGASDGPAEWSSLNLGPNVTNQCGGSMNSPIAFNTSACDTFANYEFQPGNCSMNNLEVKLLPNVVQMSYPNSSVCSASTAQFPGIDGTYAITQFHIHDSSEHKINGDYFAAELHMVFQLVNGTLNAVVALPIQPDSKTDNPVFSPILSAWKQSYLRVLEACNISTSGLDFASSRRRFTVPSKRRNLQANASSSLSAYDLIPPGSTYYTYNGSLTTPPCTQGVWWSVLDTPMLVSVRQYEQLSMVLLGYRNTTTCQLESASSPSGSTGRPIQPLNGRTVVRVCPSTYTQLSSQAGGGSSSGGATSMGLLLWTGLMVLGLVQLVMVVVFVM